MNSPTSITLSSAPSPGRSPSLAGSLPPRKFRASRRSAPIRAAAALGCVLFSLAGCAADKPEPSRPVESELPMARGPEPEKGQGNLSFHYANQSTDANLAIDLNSTDVYLEMTGKAAQEQAERMQAAPPDRKSETPARKPAAPARESKAPEESPEAPESGSAGEEAPAAPQAGKGKNPELPQPGKGLHKAPPRKPEPEPEAEAEEEPPVYEDVTAKVLSGIRRAQELFYQKRYPEAMQAVRSSQDARPTAEGYALQGSIHFMQGQTGMARRQWMEALRLNPDMPSVVNMLERTRTPGGRGSPSPRPVYRPPAPAPAPAAAPIADPEAPYPEEGSVPAPAVHGASAAIAPAPAAPPAAPKAPTAAVPAAAPADEAEDGEEGATTPTAPAAPATAAPSAPSASAPVKQPPRKAAPEKPTPAPAPAKEGHK
jgi:hypothetical protein